MVVLLEGLPRDAALWRDEMAWTNRDEMQALTIEAIDVWGRNLVATWGGKVRGEPFHIPRPHEVEEQKQARKPVTDPVQIDRWFRKWVKK